MVKSRSSSASSGSGSGSGGGGGSGGSCYRGHWRPAEDDKLRQLVEQYGPQNWNFIAEHFDGRSGKSCRLRWYNQLDPNINKNPFTEEEEERLLIYQQLHGNKWALIARHFKGRTDNAVKNHYHVIMARRRRERFTIFGNNSSSLTLRTRHGLAFPKLQSCHGKIKWTPLVAGGSSASGAGQVLISKNNVGNPPAAAAVGGSDEREEGKGGAGEEEQKGRRLPFIDFLGMGTS